MQPYELIRHAAEIIRTQCWAHGKDDAGAAVAAWDRSGAPVRLLSTATGGESRVKVNPTAWSYSIYGALVKAQEIHGEPSHIGMMWDTLMRLGRELHGAADGGTNYVHPVIQYNETEGRTKEEVLAFMEQAAAAIEAELNPAGAAP